MCHGSVKNCHCTFPLVNVCSDMPALRYPLTALAMWASPLSAGSGRAEGNRQSTHSHRCQSLLLCSPLTQPPSIRPASLRQLYEDFWAVDLSKSRPDSTPLFQLSLLPNHPLPQGAQPRQPLILCHLTQLHPKLALPRHPTEDQKWTVSFIEGPRSQTQ